MKGGDVREVFETILPEAALMEAVRASGLQSRKRKRDAVALLRAMAAMAITASTDDGGRQADVRRRYLEAGAERLVHGGFYRWFGMVVESVMETVRDRALAYVAAQRRDLPGWLGRHVSDWVIVDSSTVRPDEHLAREYPGAGDYAALKVHKHYSVGVGAAVGYHLSPAREHDSPHLEVDASWAGKGLLADLGYASLRLLRDCEWHGVRYVIRLKESWKPKVKQVTRGTLTRTLEGASDLDLLLEQEVLLLDGKVIDAAVELGSGSFSPRGARLVTVPSPNG